MIITLGEHDAELVRGIMAAHHLTAENAVAQAIFISHLIDDARGTPRRGAEVIAMLFGQPPVTPAAP